MDATRSPMPATSTAPPVCGASDGASPDRDAVETGTRAELAAGRRVAIFAVKLVHSLIFLSIAASVLHVFYAGVADRGSRSTRIALALALGESLVFTVNGFSCPLRTLAEDLGAETGQVTDIFLPRWFADRIPWFFTPPLIIGLLGLLWHRRGSPATRTGRRWSAVRR